MTTPLSPSNPGADRADAPTHDHSATPLNETPTHDHSATPLDETPTEDLSATPPSENLTEDFSATSPGDSPTENLSANPTLPYPESVRPATAHDDVPNFFAPNTEPPTTAPTSAPSARADAPRLRPRFGTILWGILLLAFAIYMVVFTLLPVPPDPTLWLLGGVIAVGLGLVVAGIAAAARRAG